MNIAVIGATGLVGQAVVWELAERGHQVAAFARRVEKVLPAANVKARALDVLARDFSEELLGCEALISTFSPDFNTNPNNAEDFERGAEAIAEAAKRAQVPYFLFVGGAGSLYVDEHVQWIDHFDRNSPYYAMADRSRHFLGNLKQRRDLNWAFLSPPQLFAVNEVSHQRSGHYRLSGDRLIPDADISVADLAVAIADDVEQRAHLFQHFSVSRVLDRTSSKP